MFVLPPIMWVWSYLNRHSWIKAATQSVMWEGDLFYHLFRPYEISLVLAFSQVWHCSLHLIYFNFISDLQICLKTNLTSQMEHPCCCFPCFAFYFHRFSPAHRFGHVPFRPLLKLLLLHLLHPSRSSSGSRA